MANEKHVLDQTVGDVFTSVVSRPATVRLGSSLQDAIDAMVRAPGTRKVYVLDENDVLVGTITVTTLLRLVGYRLGVRPSGITSFFRFLKEIMTEQVDGFMETPISVTRETTLVDATRLMVEYHLNDLPVLDEKGRLIGELNSMEILMQGRMLFDGD